VGTYSLKLDSGPGAGDAWVATAVTLEANQYYKLSFAYKKSIGLSYAVCAVYTNLTNEWYDFSSDKWMPIATNTNLIIDAGAVGSWNSYSKIIKAHPTETACSITFGCLWKHKRTQSILPG